MCEEYYSILLWKEIYMRKEFCQKDGIRITYTDNDVCFEDMKTAESVL